MLDMKRKHETPMWFLLHRPIFTCGKIHIGMLYRLSNDVSFDTCFIRTSWNPALIFRRGACAESKYQGRVSTSSDKTGINMTTSLIITLLLCIMKVKHFLSLDYVADDSGRRKIEGGSLTFKRTTWSTTKQRVPCISLFNSSIEVTNALCFE